MRNFGLVWVSGRAPGEELRLGLRARQLWQEIAELVPDVGFRPNGSLTVARDERELRVLEEACRRDDAAERGFALLSRDEVRQRNPELKGDLVAALWCERDGVVEPRRVLGALRTWMTATGQYTFLPGRNVVDARAGSVRDHTGTTIGADVVVMCPGDAYDGVATDHLRDAPLRRCRLQMMQTAPFPRCLTTSVADGDSLRYYPTFRGRALEQLSPQVAPADAHHMQLLLVQRASGELTCGDTHEYDEPFDFAVDEAPYDHLRDRAEAILGQPLPPVVRRWAGVYSQCTDDRVCYRSPVDDGVVVVTGAGGRGMTLSPALAEQTLEELAL